MRVSCRIAPKLTAFVLIAVLVGVFAGAAWHRHDELTGRVCPVCQVAHAPAVVAAPESAIAPVAVIGWLPAEANCSIALQPLHSNHSSRAPPA